MMADDRSLQVESFARGRIDLDITSNAIAKQQELIMQSIGFFLPAQKSLDRRLVIRWRLARRAKDRAGASCPLSDEIANAPAYQQDEKDIEVGLHSGRRSFISSGSQIHQKETILLNGAPCQFNSSERHSIGSRIPFPYHYWEKEFRFSCLDLSMRLGRQLDIHVNN